MLVSALAVASASSRFLLPCFVPVHDGLRDAYWGIGRAADITTRHYEADSVHISSPPPRLLQARLLDNFCVVTYGQRGLPRGGAPAPGCARLTHQPLPGHQDISCINRDQLLGHRHCKLEFTSH